MRAWGLVINEVAFVIASENASRALFIDKTTFVFDGRIILLHTQLAGFWKLNRQSPTIVNFLLLLHHGIVDPDRMIRHSVEYSFRAPSDRRLKQGAARIILISIDRWI